MAIIQKIVSLITSNPKIYDFCQLILEGDYSATIIKAVNPLPEEKIIDIGCGTGYYSKFFKCNYTGIDSEKKYIYYAQKKYQDDKNFYLADAKKTNFPAKKFDKAVLVNIIHHLDDEDLKEVLVEASRITKKETIIFDMTDDKNTIFTPLLLALDNGKFIRSMNQQLKLIKNILSVNQYFTFQVPRKLITHSVIKCDLDT